MTKTDHMFKIYGGLKVYNYPIYCGEKENIPKGRVRGRPNQCYRQGLKSGFVAGLQKGQKIAIQKAKITHAIRNRPQPILPPQLPTLQSLSLGVLRSMLKKHLDDNPDLPKKYIISTGTYEGQLKGLSYIGKPDFITILRQYNLGL